MPRRHRVIPGFRLSLAWTTIYLGCVVLLPLSALFVRAGALGWDEFWRVVTGEEVMSAYRLSFGASLLAAAVNLLLGLLVAWVLARYTFPGKRVLDAVIDLPFALPTAVAGIALTALYSERGWVGRWLTPVGLEEKSAWARSLTFEHFRYPWPDWRGFEQSWWPIGFDWQDRIALAPLGIVIALMFVGLPFVVRTVQPVLQDLNRDVEEAAASLGATRWQTFRKVILPALAPALVSGFALAFARGLGEYGSVIFISGNLPDTQIAPHQIIAKLEQYDYAGATAIAAVLLVISFSILLVINLLQRLTARGAE